jgi:hypothetical protein
MVIAIIKRNIGFLAIVAMMHMHFPATIGKLP